MIYIRDLLGHSSVVTTERYAKVSIEYKKKMIAKTYPSTFQESQITSWTKDINCKIKSHKYFKVKKS